MMILRMLVTLVLGLALSACGQDQPAQPQQKSYGAKLGDSYKGMLDEAKQGVGQSNDQARRTEQAVRERNQ